MASRAREASLLAGITLFGFGGMAANSGEVAGQWIATALVLAGLALVALSGLA